MNYYRITAYHPQENISVILDSSGYFEKLWQFSAYLVSKGFKVIAVGNEEKFNFGNMPKEQENKQQLILRACSKGEPFINNAYIKVNDKLYNLQ